MIRKLQPNDIPFVMKMVQHSVEYHYELLKDDLFTWNSIAKAHYKDVLEKSLGSNRSCVFLAEEKGFVHVCIKDGTAWVADIWVEPSARRQGVAKRLAKKALDWAKEKGKNTICANVAVKNDIAREFYEALGFKSKVLMMKKEIDN